MSSVAPPREICTSIVLAPVRYPVDLDDPTCTVCGHRAVGVVEFETSDDHERRDSFCANHAVDVQAGALIATQFAPPVVTYFDLDMYRAWSAA